MSVIIPTRDCTSLLEHQLEALSQQKYRGYFEVIISNNHPTDPIESFVRSHALRADLKMRYVDSSDKSGAAHARNVGASVAEGDFLAFCDADDAVHPMWLETLVDMAQNSDITTAALESEALNTEKSRSWSPLPGPDRQGHSIFLPFAVGSSMGCWADVYRELGGMCEDYVASEDVEFSWRAQLAGFTVAATQTELVSYRLRDRIGPIARQAYRLGYGFTQVQHDYQAQGCPPLRVRTVARQMFVLLLANPLVPTVVTRIPRGAWFRTFSCHIGVIRCAVEKQSFVFR